MKPADRMVKARLAVERAEGVNDARVAVAGFQKIGIVARRELDDKLYELEQSYWKRADELSKKRRRGKAGR